MRWYRLPTEGFGCSRRPRRPIGDAARGSFGINEGPTSDVRRLDAGDRQSPSEPSCSESKRPSRGRIRDGMVAKPSFNEGIKRFGEVLPWPRWGSNRCRILSFDLDKKLETSETPVSLWLLLDGRRG